MGDQPPKDLFVVVADQDMRKAPAFGELRRTLEL